MPEVQKSKRKTLSRSVPSLSDRVKLLEFIRQSCYSKQLLYENELYKKFGTTKVLQKLLAKQIITTTKTENVFFWKADKSKTALPKIAAEIWQQFGAEVQINNVPAAAAVIQEEKPVSTPGGYIAVKKSWLQELQRDLTTLREKTLSIVGDAFVRAEKYNVGSDKLALFITDYLKGKL